MRFTKEFLNGLPQKNVPVNEWMARLYEATAADGTLHLLAPYECPGISLLTCRMDWDIHDFETCAEHFYHLHDAIRAIALRDEALSKPNADPAAILQDEHLLQIYRTHCAPLDDGSYDSEKIYDIHERLECLELLENMEAAAARGEAISEETLAQVRADCGNLAVSEEERAYLNAYYAHEEQQAALRVGVGYAARTVCVGFRRLCRLYRMGAPALVIANELCDYATACLLHRHAVSVEHTSLTAEEIALIDHEE